jgi:hypothetical protein
MIRFWFSLLGFFAFCLVAQAAGTTTGWQPTNWQGERALVSVSHGWKAIVSLERGRLMFFGPAGRDLNLVLAPPARDNSSTWGGHRLWLGPQATWAKTWPPPKVWESSGPESYTTDGDVLRMPMADAGDGWPRLSRTYHWEGARLVCGAELHGGRRSAQFVHIIQVPNDTVVETFPQPDPVAPRGYVLLPSTSTPRHMTEFPPPAQVVPRDSGLTLRNQGGILKAGFRPQTLTGRIGALSLRVSRGIQTGQVVAEPDQGFFTQVYLGGKEPFIELEQLSPAFAPDTPASFAIVLEGGT